MKWLQSTKQTGYKTIMYGSWGYPYTEYTTIQKVQGSEKVETLKSAFITLMGKKIKFCEFNVGQQGYSSLRDFDLLYELGEAGQRRHRGTCNEKPFISRARVLLLLTLRLSCLLVPEENREGE